MVLEEWGALVYKDWLNIARDEKKWKRFIVHCPCIHEGWKIIRNDNGSYEYELKEEAKLMHQQKVDRDLRRLKNRKVENESRN